MTDQDPRVLRWRTVDGGRESHLVPGASPNTGFSERVSARIVPPTGAGWSFFVDDEPIGIDEAGCWSWAPGFYAGVVEAEIRYNDKVVRRYVLDVSPDPDKLGEESYARLIDDIRRTDPTLLTGTEPSGAHSGAVGEDQDPWVEFRRVRRHAPDFTSALRRVVARPIRSLKSSRRAVPLRMARRVDTRTVTAAAASGAIGALTDSAVTRSMLADDPLFDVPWIEEQLDGAANRCMAWLLLAFHRRVRYLQSSLDAQVQGTDSGTRTVLEARWQVRRQFLEALSREVRGFLRSEPFRSVTRPEVTAAGLNAVSSHPKYSRAYRSGWKAIRPGLAGVDPTEVVWLRPTWELYERWCFLRIVSKLSGQISGQRVKPKHGATRAWQGNSNDGRRITVLLQPRFPSFDNASAEGFRSLSREREPDIVITVASDMERRFLVLDAKYRQKRENILDAMTSAHIYHDSLRWGSHRPQAALLLVPAGGGAAWLEARETIAAHGVGVVPFAPGQEAATIDEQLSSLLRRDS